MKKFFLYILATFLYFQASISITNSSSTNITGISNEKLRSGDVHLSDIPKVIISLIQFLLAIAGTVSVIFIIYGAYQIVFGAYNNQQQKGKETIISALIGFFLTAISWLILRFVASIFM